MELIPKKCYREGCDNPRHSTRNAYCKKCRAAYQKALRLRRGQDPNDKMNGEKRWPGRPKRKMDDVVETFFERIA